VTFSSTPLFDSRQYRVVENPDIDAAAIELTDGEWEGLVYQYGKVQFEDGKPNINFERTIRKLPNGAENTEDAIEELLNNKELNELMGAILLELIDEQIKREEKSNGKTIS
jgi:hypothetical protein